VCNDLLVSVGDRLKSQSLQISLSRIERARYVLDVGHNRCHDNVRCRSQQQQPPLRYQAFAFVRISLS
jgi:hypothetical protein